MGQIRSNRPCLWWRWVTVKLLLSKSHITRYSWTYIIDGNLLKNVGSESDDQNNDSSDEEKPLNQKISLRNISKGQKKNKKEEEDDEDDEDQPLAETSSSGPKTRGTTTPDAAAVSFHFVS